MSLLRNVEYDLRRFRARVLIASLMVLVVFSLLCLRLMYLQLWRYQEFSAQAESNRTAIVPIVPNRGVIMDRNGIVLATNYSAYTLEITPSKVVEPLDEVIEQLAELIDIQGRDKRRFRKLREESKSFESVPIRTRLSDEEVARFAAQRYRFPGVEIRARLFRNYPYNELASHVIGYIGRINQSEKEKLEEQENVGNYRGTDYIGKLGVEQSYERQLHGQTGVHEMETSAGGHAVRRLRSSQATPGNTVVLSIDIKLQQLVEDMYGARRGALAQIDLGLVPSDRLLGGQQGAPARVGQFLQGLVMLGLAHGLRNRVKNETVRCLARARCRLGHARFEVVVNANRGGGHTCLPKKLHRSTLVLHRGRPPYSNCRLIFLSQVRTRICLSPS